MNFKKIAGFFVKLGFIVACFVLIFRPETFGLPPDLFQNIEPGDLMTVISEVNTGAFIFWIALACLVKLGGILAGIVRWKLLLAGQNLSMPFWYLAKCWFMGRAIGLFLPGTLGLDGYRLVESAAYTREPIKCTTVIAVEKLIGIIALFSLVFVTLPLGTRFFEFNVAVLAIVLAVLFTFISACMLVLLNPHVVRVLVAVVPTPSFIRHKVNKLGLAITAYSGHRATLIAAVGLGLCVHLGTCLMYFGTAMAITGGEINLLDTLFASPLVIVGSVLTPTVSGMGVREVVFGYVIGLKVEAAKAVTVGHLGLWAGEVLPFVLSLPLLLFTTRPDRENLMERARALRESGEADDEDLYYTDEEVREYRRKLIGCVFAGVLGGLVAGAIIGIVESRWIVATLEGLREVEALWWGPLVYGPLFAGVGLGVAAALTFFYLLFERFAPVALTYGLSAGGALAAGTLIIGKFRYERDVLDGHAMSGEQLLLLLLAGAGAGLVLALIMGGLGLIFRKAPALGVVGGGLAYAALVALGAIFANQIEPIREERGYVAVGEVPGPNIILVAVDTLRADYLKMFKEDAPTETPNLDAFAADARVLTKSFAQSSWTKPSFGTMFTSMYPTAHTANTKTSALPEEIVTFPEALLEAGYFTKGFSNNPNITAVFNFDQGFVDYVDLKPHLYFGASPSASKLSMYEVLRRIRQRVQDRLTGGRLSVADFYQPADSVTATALDWLDSGERPNNAPFFLFVHYMDPHDPFMDWSDPGTGYARVRMEEPDPDVYLEKMKDAYRQEVNYLDEHLGTLFEGMKERGLYEDSLIVFISDHGEEFYDHGGWWHGKTLYEEQIHTPLVIKLPESETAPAAREGLARHVDLGPTILSIAGAEIPETAQGVSLFEAGPETTYTYAEVDFEGNELQAVRTESYKLIQANEDNPRGLEMVELYDMLADPAEQENIAGLGDPHEGLLRKTVDDMTLYIEENAAEPEMPAEMDDATMEQLESLGYLE